MSFFSCCTSQEKIDKNSLKKSSKNYHHAKALPSLANMCFKSGIFPSSNANFLIVSIFRPTFFQFNVSYLEFNVVSTTNYFPLAQSYLSQHEIHERFIPSQ